jgi:hypothetical protein
VKTFQEFITEAEAANSIKSLAPFIIMPPLKTKGGKPNPAPQRFLINPKTGLGPTAQGETLKRGNTYLSQIVPMKTTVFGPDLKPLPHINWQGPGEKLRSVMRQKNYMDDTGRRPPKIP